MLSTIELDIATINAALDEIFADTESISNMTDNILNIVHNETYDAWGGEYSDDYINYRRKMATFINNLQDAVRMLESYNDLLKKYISDHETLDEEYGSKSILIT